MPGGSSPLNLTAKQKLLDFLSLLVFAFAMYLGHIHGITIVDSNISLQYIGIFLFPLIVTILLLFTGTMSVATYLRSSLLLFYLLATILSYPYLSITLFFAISFLITLYATFNNQGSNGENLKKTLAFSLAYLSMMIISDLFRFNIKPQNIGILLASISDDVRPGGTPLIFANGIVLFSKYMVVTLSIQSIVLFFLLSLLLVENYFLIFRTIKKRSARAATAPQLTGALSVLSCQCESITAAFPSIVSLVLSAAIIPMILESIALVGLTNYLLRMKFDRGLSSRTLSRIWPGASRSNLLVPGSMLMIFVPISYVAGTFLKLESNLFFYGMENFAMFLTGMIVIVLMSGVYQFKYSMGRNGKIAMVTASSLLMFIWFYPIISRIAVSNGAVFGAMGLMSLLGGALGGIAYVSSGQSGKAALLEYISMMFSMFAIVIFYVSILFSYRIWSIFTITQQVEFSIALWVIALPAMWLSTNLVLNYQVGRQQIEEKPIGMGALPVQ